MRQLERKADVINKDCYTLVPMHKLTEHKLIQQDIKTYKDILELPEDILDQKFVFEIYFADEDTKESRLIYGNKLNENSNLCDSNIKKIKIRFLLLYDAASKEHQKKSEKIILDKK